MENKEGTPAPGDTVVTCDTWQYLRFSYGTSTRAWLNNRRMWNTRVLPLLLHCASATQKIYRV